MCIYYLVTCQVVSCKACWESLYTIFFQLFNKIKYIINVTAVDPSIIYWD